MNKSAAATRLQSILIIDIILVAFASAAFFYVDSLPGPQLAPEKVQLADLQISQSNVLVDQPITVSINATNVGDERGIYSSQLFLDGTLNQTKDLRLSPLETKTVTFSVLGGEGTHSVAIGGIEGTFTVISRFELSDVALNRTEAKIGEPIGLSAKVTNVANESGSYSFTLSINGMAIETKTGQLDSGASASLLFEFVEQAEGTYTFNVGNINGNFTVNPSAPPPRPAAFQVSGLSIDPDVAAPGAPVNVTAKITNIGELSGEYSVDFIVNSETKGTKSGQLSGGATDDLVFSVTQTSKGNYTISVGNITGTLSVQDPSTIVLNGVFVKPYEVWAGDTVTVTVQGTNTAAQASTLPLKVKVDGVVAESASFQLPPNQQGNTVFSITAPPLQSGSSFVHSVDVNGKKGYFMVVKNGFHSLSVQMAPRSQVDFTIVFPNGTSEQHTTYWSALLPDGTYKITVPNADPTGKYPFISWDDGSTNPTRTVTLTTTTTVTATYEGGSSCPSLFVWNGTDYVYVTDVSNHGWLGYINCINADGSITYYRNNPWDYVPLNRSQLQLTGGSYNLTLLQRYNEVFYLDQAYMLVVDHQANTSVYSTTVEQYLNSSYMGNVYTIGNPKTPVSAVNEKGENVLPQISKIDDVFTTGTNGIQSPSIDKIKWNQITLNLGNLTGAKQIKLVVRAIVNWGSADDYTTWLNKFFEQPVPDGTQVTPPPYMEVKDANGNWIRVPQSRDFPLPSDGAARTYVIDLTGLFLSKDYSLRINNFWNVTFDYIAVDTTPQQAISLQRINPQASLYQAFAPGTDAATGGFTAYGNVTKLVLSEDDMFVIGRQGDAVSLQFSAAELKAPAAGMVRDYFLYESTWFKDPSGNWGFGFGFTVDPLPFKTMSSFPYPVSESYPNDTAHESYLKQWNTRIIDPPGAQQSTALNQKGFSTSALVLAALVATAVSLGYRLRGSKQVTCRNRRELNDVAVT